MKLPSGRLCAFGESQEWPQKADFADRNSSVKDQRCGQGTARVHNAAGHRKQILGFEPSVKAYCF